MKDARKSIEQQVLTWPGVTGHPHRFGGREYLLGGREIGHIHGDYLVDIPFPTRVRNEIVAAGGAKSVHLEQLPGYAPDLNPTEGVWELLKDVEMRNLCCSDFSHLHHELIRAILRLRRKPHSIQACFPGAGLAL